MKKNISIIMVSIIIICLLFINQNTIKSCTINTSLLFLSKIVPTILPLFIISKILINYNFPYYIAHLFKNNLYIYIFLLSLISGCPNNAVIIKDLLNKNQININTANKYIKCSFFSNPLFLYSMLSNIFNLKTTILIIFAHYSANIVIYLLKPIKSSKINKSNSQKLVTVLVSSIKEASNLFLNMYITILIFNIIIVIIPKSFSNFYGLIELTQGLNYLKTANINYLYKIILSLIYISYGGLSIQMQVANVLDDTPINFEYFIISRFYQIIIALIIFLTTGIIFRII